MLSLLQVQTNHNLLNRTGVPNEIALTRKPPVTKSMSFWTVRLPDCRSRDFGLYRISRRRMSAFSGDVHSWP